MKLGYGRKRVKMSLTTGEKWQKIREAYERRRVFRIWLVGNPEELGYQKNDGYDSEWLHAVSFISYMIHETVPDKETFAGTFLEWFGDTLYLAESYPCGLPFNKYYKEFYEAVTETHDLSFLRKRHEIITDYAIPKNGEPRKIFDRALKVYIAMLKEREEKSRVIKEHLESIKNLLG